MTQFSKPFLVLLALCGALSFSACGPLEALFDPAIQSATDSLRTVHGDLSAAESELDSASFDRTVRSATSVSWATVIHVEGEDQPFTPDSSLRALSAQSLLDSVSQFASKEGPALLLKGRKEGLPQLHSAAQYYAAAFLAAGQSPGSGSDFDQPLIKLEYSLLGHDLREVFCLTLSSEEIQADHLKSQCGLFKATSQFQDSLAAFAVLTSRIVTLGVAQAKGFDVLNEKIAAVIKESSASLRVTEALKTAVKDLEDRAATLNESNSKLKTGMDALGGVSKGILNDSSVLLEANFVEQSKTQLSSNFSSVGTHLAKLNTVGSVFFPGPCTIIGLGFVTFDGDLTCFSQALISILVYPPDDVIALNASMDLLVELAQQNNSQSSLLNATKNMEEAQMNFNLQYLQLQSQMQHENRSYTAISNIMKTKHDTVKNSISNVR